MLSQIVLSLETNLTFKFWLELICLVCYSDWWGDECRHGEGEAAATDSAQATGCDE